MDMGEEESDRKRPVQEDKPGAIVDGNLGLE